MPVVRRTAIALGLALAAACSSTGVASTVAPPPPAATPTRGSAGAVNNTDAVAKALPRPAHVVVVVMENHSYADIIGKPAAPYINTLAARGASFSRSYAVTHPSEPNYLALFSGSTQRLTDDSCPHTYAGANLGRALIAAGKTFHGYSEGLPSVGYPGCAAGKYARKHNPWVNFPSVPAAANVGFDRFPTNYATLPTVSFVIPNLCDDMHDCPVATGDTWLRAHLDGYARWTATHHSLLVLTWDENDNSAGNQIPTIVVGAGVKVGPTAERITHYSVLRTIEDMYGLPRAGASATAAPITSIWT